MLQSTISSNWRDEYSVEDAMNLGMFARMYFMNLETKWTMPLRKLVTCKRRTFLVCHSMHRGLGYSVCCCVVHGNGDSEQGRETPQVWEEDMGEVKNLRVGIFWSIQTNECFNSFSCSACYVQFCTNKCIVMKGLGSRRQKTESQQMIGLGGLVISLLRRLP